jgi:SAM-dependent methyltransferase
MEQVTPIYRVLRARFPQVEIIGSEYLGAGCPVSSVDGVRHEDIQNLSFPDASFDLIVSNDVFEHVPEPRTAFCETARVLRRGGILLMTVPFFSSSDTSVVRAVMEHGTLRHLLPPVYHGNPVCAEGSLVFTDFGWDLLSCLRDSGLDDPRMEITWSLELGHLGDLPFLLVASKSRGVR